MAEQILIRDFFSPVLVKNMSENIKNVYSEFNSDDFYEIIVNKLPELSFKERNEFINQQLNYFLPKNFTESAKIILASFPPKDKKVKWSSFYYMPFGTFVAQNGCCEEHFDLSMSLLYEITQRFTSEFAVRPFYNLFPEKTLTVMSSWREDKNEHIRRFVSEGSRPRLPWAPKIDQFIKFPQPLFELLKPLMNDESLYVRKSVSNHLNDISKDHPNQLLIFLSEFKDSKSVHTKWIIKQALRSLVKKGNPLALELIGFKSDQKVGLEKFILQQNEVKIGGELNFEFELINNENKPIDVLIDYLIHHQKSNGKTIPKVFKLSNKTILAGQSLSFNKKHSFKVINTRKYYTGLHHIQLQLNGKLFQILDFELN